MHSYKFFTPIAINPANGSDFVNLMAMQEAGKLMPKDIAAFAEKHKESAMLKVKGPKRLTDKSADRPGAHTEKIMWRMPSANEADPSRMALLFMDIIPHDGDYVYLPRRWLLGANVQGVFPYKMSCCQGLSSIATFRHEGKVRPALLENSRYTSRDYCDLFGLNKPGSEGVQIDHDGGELSHWYEHVIGKDHKCSDRKNALIVPGQLKIKL